MVGSWYSDTLSSGGGGGMTGSGPASQRKDSFGMPWGGGDWGAGSRPSASGPAPSASWQGPRLESLGPTGGPMPTWQQQNPTGSVNPLASYASMVNTFYGPQQQLLADQLGDQKSELAKWQAGVPQAYQSGILNRDNALALQALGLDKQGLGIDKGLNKSQLANLGKLKAILKQQYGLEGEQFTNQLGSLKIDETSLRDMSKRSQWDLRSNLTARGAFNTVANERGTGRINRDLIYGLGKINSQRTAADIAHRGNILGLDEKGIGYANTEAGLNANLAKLGISGQQLGISEQQLANKLQDGLDAIGMNGQITIGELMAGMGGTNAQSAQLLTTIYNMIASMQGLPPLPAPGGGSKVAAPNIPIHGPR